MQLILLQDVMFGYNEVPCLEEASMEIRAGEFVAVTGPNGAAKSTLLKLALGLLQPWKGEVTLAPFNGEGNKRVIAYVPQQISAFNGGFPSSVQEFVRSGRFSRGKWWSRMKAEDIEVADQWLKQMDMWEYRHRKIGELSGGQKQRICIARALAMSPDLFVLDEPTTGMDKESRSQFYRILREQVREKGRTVLLVTHHLFEIEHELDRIITLERKEEGAWKCCTTTSCSGHFVPAG
ncbi:metal ABC transporter ATP-binding protein [Paenibacillus sp. CF384]|uniref:metal ABC transporter ATP-binding protein n=1 Tax=Paenibacillus sp. CF384 TaxID=1884382 RepID=UPI0008941C06|nr:metal ABC transporter ATP-binding protein [Paenibacillus sp. CF384]SDX05409.1 zinc transport system ATP-binding protein [Paenibacillus sp. CF384]